MVSKYETLLLLSPELGSEPRQEVVTTLSGVIERDGGQVLLVDDWGTRNLAYPVRKFTRGHYIRFEYSTDGKNIAEIERIIRINEDIFKFVTVRLEEAAEEAAPEEK